MALHSRVMVTGAAGGIGGAPLNRASLLRPQVMLPPLLWLLSDEANDVTALRFDASRWNSTLPPERAAALSQAPGAWTSTPGRMRAPQQDTKT